MANLSPLNVHYVPQQFYFGSDREALARIACSRSEPLGAWTAADLVRATASLPDPKHAEAVSSQVQRAFAMIQVARSLLVLFLASLLISIISSNLRDYSPSLIIISIVLIVYTGSSGFGAVNASLAYEASRKIQLVHAGITDDASSRVRPECIYEILEEMDGYTRSGAWISVNWPDFGAMFPLPI
jgi:hypothetical protein